MQTRHWRTVRTPFPRRTGRPFSANNRNSAKPNRSTPPSTPGTTWNVPRNNFQVKLGPCRRKRFFFKTGFLIGGGGVLPTSTINETISSFSLGEKLLRRWSENFSRYVALALPAKHRRTEVSMLRIVRTTGDEWGGTGEDHLLANE